MVAYLADQLVENLVASTAVSWVEQKAALSVATKVE